MIDIIPDYHPIFVHFTLGLLGSSIGLFILTRFVMRADLKQQLLTVALWNLWLGAVVTLATMGAGWYAFSTVKYDNPSYAVMLEHRNLALTSFVVILIIVIWSWRKYRTTNSQISYSFLTATLMAAGLLLATAWYGAELVFRHGLGVISLPHPEENQQGHVPVNPPPLKGLMNREDNPSIDN
jgi:uncharacterized membrane protein